MLVSCDVLQDATPVGRKERSVRSSCPSCRKNFDVFHEH